MTEPVTDDRSAAASTSTHGFFKELLRTGLIVLLIVLPVRLFVAQPFIVSGASMQPSFATGDYLIIDQLSYQLNEPERQDVVVFRYPEEPDKFFIKRIIGLPGETVTVTPTSVNIANEEHPEGFTLDEPYLRTNSRNAETTSLTLGEDEYFVLGDNRDSSSDSRIWGALPDQFLIGRAYLRLLPPEKIEFTPGSIMASETP